MQSVFLGFYGIVFEGILGVAKDIVDSVTHSPDASNVREDDTVGPIFSV